MVFTIEGLGRLNSIVSDCKFIKIAEVSASGVKVKTEEGDVEVMWDGEVRQLKTTFFGQCPPT